MYFKNILQNPKKTLNKPTANSTPHVHVAHTRYPDKTHHVRRQNAPGTQTKSPPKKIKGHKVRV